MFLPLVDKVEMAHPHRTIDLHRPERHLKCVSHPVAHHVNRPSRRGGPSYRRRWMSWGGVLSLIEGLVFILLSHKFSTWIFFSCTAGFALWHQSVCCWFDDKHWLEVSKRDMKEVGKKDIHKETSWLNWDNSFRKGQIGSDISFSLWKISNETLYI